MGQHQDINEGLTVEAVTGRQTSKMLIAYVNVGFHRVFLFCSLWMWAVAAATQKASEPEETGAASTGPQLLRERTALL